MKAIRLVLLVFAFGLSGFTTPARAVEPSDLLKYVYEPVNSIAVINVRKILSSPRAMREGWAKKDYVEYLAGAIPVHPSVERILLAKEISPDAPGQGSSIAVVPVLKSIDLETFAKNRNGHMDEVSSEPVAILSNGTAGVKLSDTVLGLIRTETRQDVSRWIRFAKSNPSSQQSKYLTMETVNSDLYHIYMVFDTEELFHPSQVKMAVVGSKVLANYQSAAPKIEAYFSKLAGIRFMANITNKGIEAQVRIDSRSDALADANVIKSFLFEVLEKNGASLENAAGVTAKLEDGTVRLTFLMSDEELARVMALMPLPIDRVGSSSASSVASSAATPEQTKRYYKAVNAILDDLQKQNKRAKDYGKTAVWHDTAANRIEAMSVIGVDRAVVNYATGSASRLRAIAESLRGVPIGVAKAGAGAYALTYNNSRAFYRRPGGGIRYNPWGGGGGAMQTNIPEVIQKQRAIVEQDEENRKRLWSEIENARVTTRQTVAQESKYDLDS